MTTEITRLEDMSPDGSLELFKQDDGDIIMTVRARNEVGDWGCAEIEFCASGTRSPHTHFALHALFAAMEQDEAERPHAEKAMATKISAI